VVPHLRSLTRTTQRNQ